jgi:hypothetical protein
LVRRVLPITLSPRAKTHFTLSLVSGDLWAGNRDPEAWSLA